MTESSRRRKWIIRSRQFVDRSGRQTKWKRISGTAQCALLETLQKRSSVWCVTFGKVSDRNCDKHWRIYAIYFGFLDFEGFSWRKCRSSSFLGLGKNRFSFSSCCSSSWEVGFLSVCLLQVGEFLHYVSVRSSIGWKEVKNIYIKCMKLSRWKRGFPTYYFIYIALVSKEVKNWNSNKVVLAQLLHRSNLLYSFAFRSFSVCQWKVLLCVYTSTYCDIPEPTG